jgi:hypothetical protein
MPLSPGYFVGIRTSSLSSIERSNSPSEMNLYPRPLSSEIRCRKSDASGLADSEVSFRFATNRNGWKKKKVPQQGSGVHSGRIVTCSFSHLDLGQCRFKAQRTGALRLAECNVTPQ